ncbi:MAG TPA: ribonuclease R [Verrucomicrobiales bacterium]|nr:ribonuclease R [Verrucomicrobiales bacterium]
MKEQLLQILGQPSYVPSTISEILRLMGLPPQSQPELHHALVELERAGQLARTKGNRYIATREADLIPGRIRMNRQGKGFLMPDDSSIKEIAIPESATGTALHEDRVLVRRDVSARPPKAGEEVQLTGTVLRVLERNRTQVVGTLCRSPRFLYVIPDDPRIPHDIYVPEPRDVGRKANVGDKVVVQLREWESRNTNPEGEVVEVLGPPDAEGVDMLSVLRQYNLPLHFPKKVLDEARAIGSVVRPEDLGNREDCRSHNVVTIDPDDAKDFDDAICLERGAPGEWRLWVHIADVSHYVKPGSALDDEARKRGNSTYLVDRVIPMLPEALSNELCSLKPEVERLTKCVEFLVSDSGEVLKTRCYPAVIFSRRRFTYREALAVLQRPPASPIEEMLHQANELAQKIRRLRFQAGALELDFPEMKIRLDDEGRVARIERVENDISHQLIEEFMLLANEAVAVRLLQLDRPAVHRVHEEPDARRLREYRDEVLGHRVPCGNLGHRPEVQRLLHRLGTLPIGAALKIGFLKSLRRARYAIEPLGHYGLAKKRYTHFTSPIRRYADLVVHRALFDQGHGSKHSLKETADHISNTERNSADAERDSKDVKLYAFLNAQLRSSRPEPYPALVTDLRNFGFFVDVTGLGMSGLVPFSELKDDFYVFDPVRLHVIGRRNRRVVRLGDRVEVQIAKVDRFKKQVDFRLVPSVAAQPLRAGRPGARPAAPVHAGRSRPARPHTPAAHAPASQESRPPQRRPMQGRPQQARFPQARPQPGRPAPRREQEEQRYPEARPPSEGRGRQYRGSQPGRSSHGGGHQGRPQQGRSPDGRTPTGRPAPGRRFQGGERQGRPSQGRPQEGRPSSGRPQPWRPEEERARTGTRPTERPQGRRDPRGGRPFTRPEGASSERGFSGRPSDRPPGRRDDRGRDPRGRPPGPGRRSAAQGGREGGFRTSQSDRPMLGSSSRPGGPRRPQSFGRPASQGRPAPEGRPRREEAQRGRPMGPQSNSPRGGGPSSQGRSGPSQGGQPPQGRGDRRPSGRPPRPGGGGRRPR